MALRIGIDLGGTKIEGGVLDPDGVVVRRLRVPTPGGRYDETLDTIVDVVRQLERACGTRCTVGIGTPGSLSPRDGRIRNANSTCLNGRTLDHDITRRLARPVRIANDADCFALSEATDGAGRDAASVFGVILGTGTGGGLVVNGRLLSGPNRTCGEWGHNPLPWMTDDERPGPHCYCGKRGCIETFLSGPALAAGYDVDGVTAHDVAARALAGEERAMSRIARYQDRLARALAGVINIVDPEVIVLGGGVSGIDSLYPALPRLLPRYVFSDCVRTTVVRARHGDSSGVRGAAWLWPLDEARGFADGLSAE